MSALLIKYKIILGLALVILSTVILSSLNKFQLDLSPNIEAKATSHIAVPTILNASFFEGNKVITGRIDNFTPRNNELEKYQVITYFTDSTDYTKQANSKKEEIGKTIVQKINLNGVDEYVFELKTPSVEGGFVTAELSYMDNEFSGLSNPVENSTFTVNMTAMTSDAANDGLCDVDLVTPGSQCTLRAASQESNNVAGLDNIYFNIPTTDSGYRDYDDPNTPSSGDGLDGDDYWTISISSGNSVQNFNGEINLDGTTQTTNQGNLNIFGPEIEINGSNTLSTGLDIGSSTGISTVSGLVIKNFINYQVLVDEANFDLFSSYIGTDVKGLNPVTTSGQIGIDYRFMCGKESNLGTSTANGNIISNYRAIQLWSCGAGSGAFELNMKGNKFGIDPTGLIATNPNMTVIETNSNMPTITGEFGGENSNERNLFIGEIYFQNPSDSSLNDLGIYNNYFGADINGDPIGTPGQAQLAIRGLSDLGNDAQFKIGAPGKGNLFQSSGIDFTGTGDIAALIDSNSFSNIQGNGAININQCTDCSDVVIKNNFIGSTSSDPYFNKELIASNTAIRLNTAGNPIIVGNQIIGNQRGIVITRGRPTIGGTELQLDSLCNGTEANCISTNTLLGLISSNTVVSNENTIYTDNDFTGGNGPSGNVNIEQVWQGGFEILSGNSRRTDIANGAFQLPTPVGNRIYSSVLFSSLTSNLVNTSINCSGGESECETTAGNSSGISGKTLAWTASPYYISEYTYNGSGVKTVHGNYKFETNHVASQTFSFDGNSTTHPVISGPSRVLGLYTYQDLGYRWTDNPTADRVTSFGTNQYMEVQMVDANPILNGGNYEIIVDSKTNTDNVSLQGYDDGSGSWSGGGVNGVDGLPNNATSLREAVWVAKSFAQPVTIKFTSGVNPFNPTNTITLQSPNTSNPVVIDGEGKTFNGTGMPEGSSCIEVVDAYNITIKNFVFINCKESAIKISGNSYGIKFEGNTFSNTSSTKIPIDISGGTSDSNNITANDTGDVDTGANNLMNSPVITSVSYIGSQQYTVSGIIDGLLSEAPYTITICESADHASNHGGCTTVRGTTTTSNNNWTSTFTRSGDNGTQTRIFSAYATNSLNSSSEFSANFVFPYSVITPSSPTTGIDDATPLFSWGAITHTLLTNYQIYLDGNLLATIPVGTTTYQYTGTPLTGNHTWQIFGVKSNGGAVGESNIQNFSINTYPLTLTSPVGATLNSLPLFTWEESLDSTVEEYNIYLDGNIIGTVNFGINEFQYSGTPISGIHTWWVEAIRADESISGTSNVQQIDVNLLDISVNSPSSNALVNTQRPIFSWTLLDSEEVDTYEVILNDLVIGTVAPNISSYQPNSDIPEGTYIWQIIAKDVNGFVVGESDEQNLEILIIDSIIGVSISELSSKPIFSWTPINSVFKYQIFLNNQLYAYVSSSSNSYQVINPLQPGTYSLIIKAIREGDVLIAQSESVNFTVSETVVQPQTENVQVNEEIKNSETKPVSNQLPVSFTRPTNNGGNDVAVTPTPNKEEDENILVSDTDNLSNGSIVSTVLICVTLILALFILFIIILRKKRNNEDTK